MANYSGTITYNSNTLGVKSLTPNKTQKTRKTIIGKTLIETQIIGLAAQQWELQISGIITGTRTEISTARATLEALDTGLAYAYVDGIHDGNFRIRTGTLSFEDLEDQAGSYYSYTITLVES